MVQSNTGWFAFTQVLVENKLRTRRRPTTKVGPTFPIRRPSRCERALTTSPFWRRTDERGHTNHATHPKDSAAPFADDHSRSHADRPRRQLRALRRHGIRHD